MGLNSGGTGKVFLLVHKKRKQNEDNADLFACGGVAVGLQGAGGDDGELCSGAHGYGVGA